MIYLVFRNSLTNCTVFLNGTNTNLPPCKTSVMAVDTEIVLYLPMDFATESLKLMVDVVIFLNVVAKPLTLSDNDIDCVIVLNALNNLDILSFNDILSVNPLIELYTLDTLSDNDILGSVIVSLLISLLANESVIGCDCIAVSNGGELKYAVSNKAPKS